MKCELMLRKKILWLKGKIFIEMQRYIDEIKYFSSCPVTDQVNSSLVRVCEEISRLTIVEEEEEEPRRKKKKK